MILYVFLSASTTCPPPWPSIYPFCKDNIGFHEEKALNARGLHALLKLLSQPVLHCTNVLHSVVVRCCCCAALHHSALLQSNVLHVAMLAALRCFNSVLLCIYVLCGCVLFKAVLFKDEDS